MSRGSAKDLKLEEGKLKIYGIGDFGTGKSTFASTFPTPGYVFDFDKRIASYRGKDWEYSSFDMSFKGWVEFDKEYKQVKKEVEEGKFKTIVLDSTTSMMDTAMERAMQLDPKRSPEGGPIWNVHYQIVKNLMEPKLHGILSMDCNVVILGHWKLTIDQRTGNIIGANPLLTGNLAEKVPGYFDEVYAFFNQIIKGENKYFFRTVTKGFYGARSTISGMGRLLPDQIPNTYQDLEKYIINAVKKEQGE